MKHRYAALRGTRDILPDDVARWRLVEDTAREVFERYGFRELRTPLIEKTELFARSVGPSTDIVRKEMYTFERGDDSVSLRPENTASVVRAFVEHAMHRGVASGYPERLYYMGPMFRYERPQKGRQRQFHQIGAEVLGAVEPLADAETLEMLWAFLQALGLEDLRLMLNSVGDDVCRPDFRERLIEWLAPWVERLCEDCRRRYRDNPLRVLDCKVDEDRRLLSEAPRMLDRLCEPCRVHFEAVKTTLDDYGIPYEVDPGIVRGLDYYQRTVFEVVSSGLGAQDAVLGGGRYDGLVEEIGGPATPGFGFAIGVERLLLLLPAERVPRSTPDVALVGLGPEGWQALPVMARRLRAAGLRVLAPIAERPMGAQLKRADRSGARFALFVGKDELERDSFGLKDLSSGEQREVGASEIPQRVGRGHGG